MAGPDAQRAVRRRRRGGRALRGETCSARAPGRLGVALHAARRADRCRRRRDRDGADRLVRRRRDQTAAPGEPAAACRRRRRARVRHRHWPCRDLDPRGGGAAAARTGGAQEGRAALRGRPGAQRAASASRGAERPRAGGSVPVDHRAAACGRSAGSAGRSRPGDPRGAAKRRPRARDGVRARDLRLRLGRRPQHRGDRRARDRRPDRHDSGR